MNLENTTPVKKKKPIAKDHTLHDFKHMKVQSTEIDRQKMD